jgi:hypothetical protein
MKKLFVVLCCTFMVISIFGQDQVEQPREKKGYIGISIGAAIPVGEFGSTDIGSDEAGFAKTGLTFQLVNFGYRFSKHLGIAAMWSGGAFNMDEVALRNNAGLGSVTIDMDPWGFGTLMGGLLISIPSPVVDVDFRIMIGPGYGMAPEIQISGYDIYNNYIVVVQESGDAYAFASDIGVGLRFNITRLININLLMDYMTCKPKFSVDMYSNGSYIGSNEWDQPMDHITITGGIGFRL